MMGAMSWAKVSSLAAKTGASASANAIKALGDMLFSSWHMRRHMRPPRRIWRRKRDSNPRASYPANGFQDRRFQPLTHSSISKLPDFLNTAQSWLTRGGAHMRGLLLFAAGVIAGILIMQPGQAQPDRVP